ncbi:hypothetical protein Pla22_33760 [Rubripirellula amarantea]|uniref:Uncharacterized protein n=1 Tax=Rubripirellula amarantea TaxID=2527999 RepID=A0A5C5WKY8_9BACT|nr:hypothetical protein [Rubripirellula amarantea]TWT50633.1 hypothetical protein Pla22_33760 [Rubripirellula amarantea]
MTKTCIAVMLFLTTIPLMLCQGQSLGYSQNRIAMSFDGNSAPDNEYKWPTGDPDDWGALPASCAIIAKLGLQEQLVHCSYNNFIDAPPGPDAENQLKIGADGAIKYWGFKPEAFFDVTTQQREAIESLASEMAKSTQSDPLYFIHAGLSEFVYLVVDEVVRNGNVDSLSHVHLVSHSGFNENERRRPHHHTWSDVQELSGGRIQYAKIKDQNHKEDPNHLWHSGKDFSVWHWMRDHSQPDVRWMYSRLEAHSGNVADISDCGMLFYLLVGDDDGSPKKFEAFIGDGVALVGQTDQGNTNGKVATAPVSLNALKDFDEITVDGFAPAYRDPARKALAIDASKHQGVYAAATTRFPGDSGVYDVTLEALTELDGESTYRLVVDGNTVGTSQNPATEKDYQPHQHHFRSVELKKGSTIQIEFNSQSNGKVPEGDAFAFARGRWRHLSFEPTKTFSQSTVAGSPATKESAFNSPDQALIIIEAEDMERTTGWRLAKGEAASGGKYVVYEGNNSFARTTKHRIKATFKVEKAGSYSVKWSMRQPDDVPGDQANDAWLCFTDAKQLARQTQLTGFHKFVGRSKGSFGLNGQLDLEGDQPWMTVEFPKPGEYQLEIAGRSQGFQLDRVVLYQGIDFEDLSRTLQ